MLLLDATVALLRPRNDIEDKHLGIDRLAHERRFLPTSAELESFTSAIKLSPLADGDKMFQAGTTTWTTYFDTEDWLYFLSCDGPTARRLRVREYEGPREEGRATPCYLELKQTTGTSRFKVRLTAPIATLARFIDGSVDVEGMFIDPIARSAALRTIRNALEEKHFSPCVGTSYRRRCLASTPDLRVTLDEDLTFFHPVSFGLPRDNQQAVAIGPARVLEVKYAMSLPDWLAHACEGLSEAPDFSKFRIGMLAVQQAILAEAPPTRPTPRDTFCEASEASSRSPAAQLPAMS
jgi:hypothetical protein